MSMYNKILLPTDGSLNAQRAGNHALWIADKNNAEIVVLNVIDVNYLQPSYLPSFKKNLDNCLRDEGNKALQSFKKDVLESQCQGFCKNIKFTTMIKEGKPYLMILKTIKEKNIDLVIMGASGIHGVDQFILGNVTERVLREAKTPILVVR
jgi:nucleotide-binding universal stress UspA family protein